MEGLNNDYNCISTENISCPRHEYERLSISYKLSMFETSTQGMWMED